MPSGTGALYSALKDLAVCEGRMALNPWEPEERLALGDKDGAYSLTSLSLKGISPPHDSGPDKTREVTLSHFWAYL